MLCLLTILHGPWYQWSRGEREFPFPAIPWESSLKFLFPSFENEMFNFLWFTRVFTYSIVSSTKIKGSIKREWDLSIPIPVRGIQFLWSLIFCNFDGRVQQSWNSSCWGERLPRRERLVEHCRLFGGWRDWADSESGFGDETYLVRFPTDVIAPSTGYWSELYLAAKS